MIYYIQVKNNEIIGKANVKTLNEDVTNIEVAQEVYDNSEKYIYQNGNIVLNPNYEEEQAELRKAEFDSEFFNTSLGWVRRKVTMKDGATKDFLSDILSLLQVGVPIITYNAPDFTTGENPTQNTDVIVTEQFIAECKQQVLLDFYGAVKAE